MAWLTQPVAELIYQGDRPTTQTLLLSVLARFGLPAEELPTHTGLVARCLTLCATFGLWRCWSDALEFRFEELPQKGTRVTITAIPNFLRLGVKQGERVTDVGALLTALQAQ